MACFEEVHYSATVREFKCVKNLHIPLIHMFSFFVLVFFMIAFAAYSGSRTGLFLIIFTSICLLTRRSFSIVEESITVIKKFGIQLKIKYKCGIETKKFIEAEKLERVFIHEYIYRSQVKFSLAVIISGEKRLHLVFKHLYPGFNNLRLVYMNCEASFR